MPAYRVPLPQQVYDCLLANPDGCPYEQMARFFRQQAAEGPGRGTDTEWPSYCQTTERWRDLAPPLYQNADQINEPLGEERAEKLARALGIKPDMILTRDEYACVMGVPPRDRIQQILYACFIDFTASKGNQVVVPFSSYGLNLNEQGNVLSLCAPKAPCLETNEAFLLCPRLPSDAASRTSWSTSCAKHRSSSSSWKAGNASIRRLTPASPQRRVRATTERGAAAAPRPGSPRHFSVPSEGAAHSTAP